MKKAKQIHKTTKSKTAKSQSRESTVSENLSNSPVKHTIKGKTKVKIVGVGGGGGNAISRMMSGNVLRGVEFIAINTDAQDLDYAQAHKKLYIGRALTKGLGAGMNPEIGRQAAEENKSEIAEALDGADVIFLTIGLGGGTGSGAGPIVADIAKEKGILTIGVVTKPFSFEGAQRANIAQEALSKLKDKVDALVVIPNDKIFSVIDKETSLAKAFGYIDDILKNGVQALTEIINSPGIINVDFADIKSILKDAGHALIGVGIASGQDRAIKAVQQAINSPLLEVSIEGARGILFSVGGGRDLKMSEIHDVAKAISANLENNTRVIFGAYYDYKLKDKQIKVTVIAAGYNNSFNQQQNKLLSSDLFIGNLAKPKIEKKELVENKDNKELKDKEQKIDFKAQVDIKEEKKDVDSWDIPTFLRKKQK
ncbi:MAG: cell division protein FtsZ [Minisyncoccia bacterium]